MRPRRLADNSPVDLQSIAIKLSRSENLPVLSQVASSIIKLADDPSASPKALERMLEREPAICAKILKVANSAYYGSNVVPSIGRAISVLGMNTVRSLVTTIVYHQMMSGKSQAPLFSKIEFWKHSLATATAARILGKLKMPLKAEELYSAGMMHDIGILVMERFAPELLQDSMRKAVEDGIPLLEAEQMTCGFTHPEVGLLLADRWNLTPTLKGAIRYHHEPIADQETMETTALISAANTLAHQCGFKTLRSKDVDEFDMIAADAINMPEDQLEVIRNVLHQEVTRAETTFGMSHSEAA